MKGLPKEVVFFYSDDETYLADEPCFYAPEEFPAAKAIAKNYEVICNELNAYMNGTLNVSVNNPNPPNLGYDDSWKHLYFMNFLWQFSTARKLFPKTYSIIQQFPEISLAGIASLEGGGKVLPHCGDTNAIVRCHLGLKIPGKLPDCGMRVKEEYRSWEQGGVICFNDAYEHEAWNLTTEKRFVFIFDIIRPQFMWARKNICAYALGVLSFKYLARKLKLLKRAPLSIKKIMCLLPAMGWRVYLIFQK